MEMLKNKYILLCEQAKENWNQTGRQKGSQQLMGWHVAQTACITQEPIAKFLQQKSACCPSHPGC